MKTAVECPSTTNSTNSRTNALMPHLTIVAAFVAAFMWAFLPLAQAQSTQTPWQNLTLPQLTAVWWRWAVSIPVSDSPLFDDPGAKAYTGQPYSDLLFLVVTFSLTSLQ